MISTDLANLADFCLGIAAKGEHLGPNSTARLAKILLDMSRYAKRLEQLPFDPADLTRLDDDDE